MTTEPEVSIPYGALIDNIERDRDRERFTYLGELYSCPHDLLASALTEAAPEPVPPGPAAEMPAAAPKLEWEPCRSSHFSVMRSKVPGGWLVALGDAAITFYPDPSHQWDGTSRNG